MSYGSPLVLVDANVFISYLLPSKYPDRVVAQFVESIVFGEIRHVFPEAVVEELLATVARKRKLNSRISVDDLAYLIEALRKSAITAERIETPFPRTVRDVNDDYLIAYALEEEVDFLVTYDVDLLSLMLPEGSPRIVTPPMLFDVLDRLKQGPPEH